MAVEITWDNVISLFEQHQQQPGVLHTHTEGEAPAEQSVMMFSCVSSQEAHELCTYIHLRCFQNNNHPLNYFHTFATLRPQTLMCSIGIFMDLHKVKEEESNTWFLFSLINLRLLLLGIESLHLGKLQLQTLYATLLRFYLQAPAPQKTQKLCIMSFPSRKQMFFFLCLLFIFSSLRSGTIFGVGFWRRSGRWWWVTPCWCW